MKERIGNIVKSLRNYRKLHKWFGLGLAFFILISSITGLALAYKKEFDILQPPSQKGVKRDLVDALPLDSLAQLGSQHFKMQQGFENEIDRIDVRPSKGMAKILFDEGYWEVQVDLHTGQLLSISRRHSDWIEALHDGSIISDFFKKLSMSTLALGLIFMLFSGVWLYYGPGLVKKLRK